MNKHDWMLQVLTDLVEYTRLNELQSTENLLIKCLASLDQPDCWAENDLNKP
jgi:hypothetical protein